MLYTFAMRWLRPGRLVIYAAIVFLIVDFLPEIRPPDFRYNGSDPERPVYNIGWPVALVIYDPLHGLNIGPWLFIELPPQVCILLLLHAVTIVCRPRAA